MHSLKCCSLQGERQEGEDGRDTHPHKAPGHTSSSGSVSCPPPPRTSHRPGATSVGWEQRSFFCQEKAEGLIFICQEGNDLRDFPGDFLLPKASGWEQGDTISQTSSGRTPGEQPSGKGVILCPRDMHIPMSEVVLSHQLTPNSQTMPKPPSSLQGKGAGREGGREKMAPEMFCLQVPK